MGKTQAPVQLSKAALRVVLFGMPHSGKSSLLGALLQASNDPLTNPVAKWVDVSGRMGELRRRLYEHDPERTADEIVLYPARFDRSTNEIRGTSEAVFVDCSGLASSNILARHELLCGSDPSGSLARFILEADALFLVVDAAANAVTLEAEFAQFKRFLNLLERSRGRRTDVSGLPTFLVLTKCDLLARKGDSAAEWIEQIEERKIKVAHRFEELLSRGATENQSPFGQIELNLWATAARRPGLADSPAPADEPFGVVELFRQGIEQARGFRSHRRRSTRRLFFTVGSVFFALAFVAGSAALLVWMRMGTDAQKLESRVDRFRGQFQAVSVMAAHRGFKQKIEELKSLKADSDFERLPDNKQEFVRERLHELQAYEEYEKGLADIIDPRDAGSLAQLDVIEASLKSSKSPDEFRAEWSQTEAGRRHADWLEDVSAIRTAVEKIDSWYRRLTADGHRVLDDLNGPNLPARAKKVLLEGRTPPFPEDDRDKLLPGSRRVSYAHVFGFAGVAENRRKWEEVKKRLEPYSKVDSN